MFHILYLILTGVNKITPSQLLNMTRAILWRSTFKEHRLTGHFLAFFFDFSASSWAFLLAASLLAWKKRAEASEQVFRLRKNLLNRWELHNTIEHYQALIRYLIPRRMNPVLKMQVSIRPWSYRENRHSNQEQNGTNLTNLSLLSEHDLVVEILLSLLHHHDGQSFFLCFLLLLQACQVFKLHFSWGDFDLQRLKRPQRMWLKNKGREGSVEGAGWKASYLALWSLLFHLLKTLLFSLFIIILFIVIVLLFIVIIFLLIVLISFTLLLLLLLPG